jgi:hypothetical protein
MRSLILIALFALCSTVAAQGEADAFKIWNNYNLLYSDELFMCVQKFLQLKKY